MKSCCFQNKFLCFYIVLSTLYFNKESFLQTVQLLSFRAFASVCLDLVSLIANVYVSVQGYATVINFSFHQVLNCLCNTSELL